MVLFVPRSVWFGSGEPHSGNYAVRPRLVRPVPTITRHYTGAPIRLRNSNDDVTTYMRWMQSVAYNSGKSFEYNYIIPPRSDGSAQVWEYAGDYRAAHSYGENDIAIGVQFAIGVSNHPSYTNYDPTRPTVWEPLTDAMVEAYQWLRDEYLIPRGICAPTVDQLEHRAMPGAATACPGQSVIGRSADLLAPFNPAPSGGRMAATLTKFRRDTREGGGGRVTELIVSLPPARPAWAKAAIVNVTVTQPENAGFVVAGPGPVRPVNDSNVNFAAGQTIANEIMVPMNGDVIMLWSTTPVHMIVDLRGWAEVVP